MVDRWGNLLINDCLWWKPCVAVEMIMLGSGLKLTVCDYQSLNNRCLFLIIILTKYLINHQLFLITGLFITEVILVDHGQGL